MTWARTLILAAALVGLPLLLGPAQGTVTTPACGEHVPHPPIHVVGDAGATGLILGHDPITGEPIYRPGSGVVAGMGTPADPFVIGGWCILSGREGIRIEGTSAHLVIQENLVLVSSLDRGITLAGTTHVHVTGNEVRGAGTAMASSTSPPLSAHAGILLSAAENTAVDGNSIHGLGPSSNAIYVLASTQTTVHANTVAGIGNGVLVTSSVDRPAVGTTIAANTLTSCGGGVVLDHDARGTVIQGNHVQGCTTGILVTEHPGPTLIERNLVQGGIRGFEAAGEGHVLRGNQAFENTIGIALLGPRNLAENNEVRGSSMGFYVRNAEDALLRNNDVRDSTRAGIRIDHSDGALVLGNNIHGNTPVGIEASGPRLDARENWWGCADGPGAPGCDGIDGDVLYDPWLTAPNPDAGAGT